MEGISCACALLELQLGLTGRPTLSLPWYWNQTSLNSISPTTSAVGSRPSSPATAGVRSTRANTRSADASPLQYNTSGAKARTSQQEVIYIRGTINSKKTTLARLAFPFERDKSTRPL